MQQRGFHRYRFLLPLFSLFTGCAQGAGQARPLSSPTSQVQNWLEQGRELSRLGQSVRAEQYLLAAWDAGASVDEVAPLLIEICVRDGRIRSALIYVQRVRHARPNDSAVLQLSATLHLALGQSARAQEDVAALEILEPTRPEALFFLGEYLLLHGQVDRGRRYLSAYLERAPDGEDAPWVHSLMSQRLSRESVDAPADLAEPTTDFGQVPQQIEIQKSEEGDAS